MTVLMPEQAELQRARADRDVAAQEVDACRDTIRAACELRDAARWPRTIARTTEAVDRAVRDLEAAERIYRHLVARVDYLGERG